MMLMMLTIMILTVFFVSPTLPWITLNRRLNF